MFHLIVNYCSGGLGNRLKPLASCGVISTDAKVNLGMFWQPTMRCQTHFNDLFKNQFQQFDDDTLGALGNVEIHTVPWYIDHDLGLNRFRSLKSLSVNFPIRELSANMDHTHNIVVYNNDWLPTVPQEESNKFLKTLQPLDFLQDEIEKFCKENAIDKSVIGVHARGTDFEDGSDILGGYIRAIESVTGRVFVCSDSLDYENTLKSRFGDRIIFRKKQSYVCKHNPCQSWVNNVQTPMASVQESLIDLYILSRTNFTIYNPSSTFAHVALALS